MKNNSKLLFYHLLSSALFQPHHNPPLCLVAAVLFPESLKVQTGKNPLASLRPSSPRGPVPTTYTHTEVKILLRVMYPEKNNRLEWPRDWRKGKSSHLFHPSNLPHSPIISLKTLKIQWDDKLQRGDMTQWLRTWTLRLECPDSSPGSVIISSVTLGKLFHFAMSQFPYL